MRSSLGDIVFSICMMTVILLLLWGGIIEPGRSRERVAIKLLEVYQQELDAGIKKENSKALSLLKTLGESDKIKEHDYGND